MELDLLTIERIERYIVFDGAVRLLHWEDTSSHGFKIRLGLASRADLDSFDGTMKRRKHRGGQRYHCILFSSELAGIEPQMEAQFCGRGWAEAAGAHIALHIPGLSDQNWWREQRTDDQEGECSTWNIMLMEIGDDEVIIDQTMRDRAERAELKGGPRSKHVARMLQDHDFNRWVSCASLWRRPGARPDDPAACYTLDDIDALMKKICHIESKVEFDHGNEAAWQIWETQFKAPFIRYCTRRPQRKGTAQTPQPSRVESRH